MVILWGWAVSYERGTPVELCLAAYDHPRDGAHCTARVVNLSRCCQLQLSSRVQGFLSLIRKRHPVGPYSRPMPRALWQSYGGGQFHMSEVHICASSHSAPLPMTSKVSPQTPSPRSTILYEMCRFLAMKFTSHFF